MVGSFKIASSGSRISVPPKNESRPAKMRIDRYN